MDATFFRDYENWLDSLTFETARPGELGQERAMNEKAAREMTKRDQIIGRIQERGEGYRVDAREVWLLALDCECSAQYVRTVRAELRAAGALDAANCYVGRWVRPEELAAYLQTEDSLHIGLILSEARKIEMARHFQTTPRKLIAAIEWAISSRLIEERFSYYGWHLLAA